MPKKQTSGFIVDENKITLSILEDKLVLAVAPIKVEGEFCYVYSLICPKENNSFIMEPKVEISMSTDPDVATMHYAATKKMSEYQSKAYPMFHDMFKQRIDMFYQHTK